MPTAKPLPAHPTIENVCKRFKLTDSHLKQVLGGKVITEDLDATNDKDLSVLVVALVNATVEETWEFTNANKVQDIQAATLDAGDIDLQSDDPLGAMVLEDEALHKLEKDPGGLYFLSKVESKVMKNYKKSHKGDVMACLRDVLMGRVRAYYEHGLAGIEPYDGDSKGRSPAKDLEHANKFAFQVIDNPYVKTELVKIPKDAQMEYKDDEREIIHTLAWSIQKGRDLACPTLNHYIRLRNPNVGCCLITRRFYSGYDYDSSQIGTGVLPTDGGEKSVVFYTNHTYTSKVAGFGGSAKRTIGRKMMVGSLVSTMERAQKEAATGGKKK